MQNPDIKLKSKVIIEHIESRVLELKKKNKTLDDIDIPLRDIIVSVRRLDLMRNDKLKELDVIVLGK
ncbi:hypothetical protein [Flavobacterium sp. LB1P71]|uniref:hypothetical protein n=1 Tax=Flavobacterium sp. LB1P71 TaxID=3401716 RepID=UPI003AAF7698